ncbi:MAG TPA: PQQ-binding-like beta-propeller repeat protein [Gemmataceae bacterium]|nr:PQQ-binding-like beta-propeller repeat protein [Gemmataceae bacterium]
MTGSRILTALACVMAAAAAAADWPQFLGPTRNGVSTETGLKATWPKDGPPVVWQKDVGDGFSGPVVVGDRVILFHRVGDEEVVECLSTADGTTKWKKGYPTSYHDAFGKGDGPRATPLIADGRIYTLGAEGILQCLKLEDGDKVWRKDLHKDYQVQPGFFGVATSPLLEGDRLLVNVGGANGAGIVAFGKDDGKELWKADDHDASYSSPVAADLAGKRQAVFFTREGLISLDPADGAVRYSKHWRSRMDASVNAASPVVVGDQIFLTACYGTGAVLLRAKPDGLEQVWSNDKSMSCHYGTPIYKDGYLYGFDGRQEEGARLRCIEMKSGDVKWTEEGFGCGSMILADGKLIILTENGDLVLAKAAPEKYEELARATVLQSRPLRAPIALADGKLYGRDGRKLVCWNLK